MSETATTITRAATQGMVTIRGDLENAKFRAAVASVCGHDVPGVREISGGLASGLGWMSPDELMLFCPHGEAPSMATRLEDALSGTHHLALDVSDARAVFAIAGSPRDVLAKLAPVDMAPGQFQPGMIRRTRLAQVPAAFWLESASLAHLVCFRSVAQYVEDLLTQAGQGTLNLDGWSGVSA